MPIDSMGLTEAYQQLNLPNLNQIRGTILVPSTDIFQYSLINDKYCHLQMDTVQWLYCICLKNLNWIRNDKYFIIFILISYNVTPELHTSTLKPAKCSSPLAISGGWNAGEP